VHENSKGIRGQSDRPSDLLCRAASSCGRGRVRWLWRAARLRALLRHRRGIRACPCSSPRPGLPHARRDTQSATGLCARSARNGLLDAVQAGSAGRATPMPSCAHAPHHAQARSEFRLCARGRSWECVRAPQRSPPPVSRHRTAEPAFTPVCCGFISQHLQLKRAVAAQVAPARPRIASTESAAPTAHGQRGWTAKKRPLGRTALRGVHCSPVRQPS
jgi:hypothetical protein